MLSPGVICINSHLGDKGHFSCIVSCLEQLQFRVSTNDHKVSTYTMQITTLPLWRRIFEANSAMNS